jgi:hypothetical protein
MSSSCWSFNLLREEFLSAPIHSPLSGRLIVPSDHTLWFRSLPQSVMTTEKDVVPPQTIKTKSTSVRNIFSKTNVAPGSTISFVTSNQLLRTRNQKKNQQVRITS